MSLTQGLSLFMKPAPGVRPQPVFSFLLLITMEILKFHWSVIYNNREDDHVNEGFLLEEIFRWCYSFSEARMSKKSAFFVFSLPGQDLHD